MNDANYPPTQAYPPPPPPPINPYLAPSAPYPSSSSLEPTDAERIRRELIAHEASIRSLGGLHLFGAVVMGLYCLILAGLLVSSLITGDQEFGMSPALFLLVAFLALLGGLEFWIGRGLRALDVKVRTAASILAGLGLLGIPIGTIINGYFLYLLVSQKGTRVFSPEYQDVIRATPHVKHKSPWLAGCLIVLGVAALVGFYIYFASR